MKKRFLIFRGVALGALVAAVTVMSTSVAWAATANSGTVGRILIQSDGSFVIQLSGNPSMCSGGSSYQGIVSAGSGYGMSNQAAVNSALAIASAAYLSGAQITLWVTGTSSYGQCILNSVSTPN